MKRVLTVTIIVFAIILLWWGFEPEVSEDQTVNTETENVEQDREPISIVAENLNVPWGLAHLPNGELLVTQRPGNLTLIDENGDQTDIATGLDINNIGEGGLLGLALDPEFGSNDWLYMYVTLERNGETFNQILRFQFDGEELSEKQILVDNIPGGRFHNGGRIAFGPDGYLYITTGDAEDPSLAQDLSTLAGKILRIEADGSIPADNPFNDQIFSYGHRNPQGLTWDDDNNLWASEHGPVGFDEINLIETGNNFGWPIFKGSEIHQGGGEIENTPPKRYSGADTWAPAGIVYLNDNLFFAGLRGSALFEAVLEGNQVVELKEHLDQYGRIRTVKVGPDGYMYIMTSNRDGRGQPNETDDRIIRIDPEILN